jgi:hypothetical protein
MVMQAEDGSLSGGATVADCDTCVAGARVRYVGRVDVRATIPSAGTYDVTVVYEVDGKRRLDVSINGEPPIAARTVTGSNWTTPQMLTVRTTLPAGSIDIGLYGDDSNGPDLDAVTIS